MLSESLCKINHKSNKHPTPKLLMYVLKIYKNKQEKL